MQVANVNSASLGNRWDPEFHIALTKLATRVAELRGKVPAADAIKLVEAVALPDKQALKILLKGHAESLNTERATLVTHEYPHFALALIEVDIAQATQRIEKRIAAEVDNRQALEAILKAGA